MLDTLTISNFLFVRQLQLQFEAEMCVLTGETGAGKSLLINALSLILGARGTSQWVRAGCDKADLTASFSPVPKVALAQLTQLDIPCEEETIYLRRSLFANGKTKAYINDTPITVKTLKALGATLVDIYGQHSHYALLDSATQRAKLDAFGKHTDAANACNVCYQQWQALDAKYHAAQEQAEDDHNRRELLAYQLEEFSALNLQEDEFLQLEQTQAQLAQADQLHQTLQQALATLYTQDASTLSAVESLSQQFTPLAETYPELAAICTPLQEVEVQLQEVIQAIKSTHIESDAEQLAYTETRLSTLFDLARKHQCQPQDLYQSWQVLQTAFADLDKASANLEVLDQKRKEAWQALKRAAVSLTEKRQDAALRLAQVVSTQIQALGMQGATFKVSLQPQETIHHYGQEQVQFEIETNPGQGFSTLSQSASGGELSRLGLAIQVCAMDMPSTPTIVLDEVDAGIGGETANQVGELLAQLAAHSQVLCVTHLPQIANLGTQHIKVDKQLEGGEVQHTIEVLGHTARIEEIARMLDGVTEQSLKHAEALLAKSG